MSPAGRRPAPRRPRPRSDAALWRTGWLLVVLLGLAAGLWWTARAPEVGDTPPASAQAPVAIPVTPGARRTPASVVPKPGGRRAPGVPRDARGAAPTPAGLVAIIFDDAGANLQQLEPILSLNRLVTIAVLPGLAASRAVAEQATAAGLEVLLHLPLEAEEAGRALGPGGVTTVMTDEEIAAVVSRGLGDVPGAVGINSHMGSRGTADRRVMAAVLGVVQVHGLFFVDSRTTPRTVGSTVARELGVVALERNVFLDNEDDPVYIAGQIRQLLEVATARGAAIAIGHAQKMTAEVLRLYLPEFDRAGLVLVPVSALIRAR